MVKRMLHYGNTQAGLAKDAGVVVGDQLASINQVAVGGKSHELVGLMLSNGGTRVAVELRHAERGSRATPTEVFCQTVEVAAPSHRWHTVFVVRRSASEKTGMTLVTEPGSNDTIVADVADGSPAEAAGEHADFGKCPAPLQCQCVQPFARQMAAGQHSSTMCTCHVRLPRAPATCACHVRRLPAPVWT
jgi:hypothetical protein